MQVSVADQQKTFEMMALRPLAAVVDFHFHCFDLVVTTFLKMNQRNLIRIYILIPHQLASSDELLPSLGSSCISSILEKQFFAKKFSLL